MDEWLDAQTREQWRERFACWLLEQGWLKEELQPAATMPADDGFESLALMAAKGISGG